MSNRRLLCKGEKKNLTYVGKLTVGVYSAKKWEMYGFGEAGNGIIGAISPVNYIHNGISFSIQAFHYRTDTSRIYFSANPIEDMLYEFTLNINGVPYNFSRTSPTKIPMSAATSNPFTTGQTIPISFSF